MTVTTRSRSLIDLDRYAIGLSGLCAVHCVATTVLIALVSTAGGLLDPRIHEAGLSIAIVLGALALGRGVLRHGQVVPVSIGGFGLGMMGGAMALPHDGSGAEALWTIVGVALLAVAHHRNRRAVRKLPVVAGKAGLYIGD